MKKLVPVLCLATAAVAGTALPAAAQPSGDTIVTFNVATANLNVEVPASVNLGSAFPGQTLSGQLGTVRVRVRDERAAASATWVASVVATQFTTGTDDPTQIVQPQLVEYWSGPATAVVGTGTVVAGQPTRADRVSLGQPRVAFSKTSGAGNNQVAWIPTIEIIIPAGAVGGLYEGTVTHSVS